MKEGLDKESEAQIAKELTRLLGYAPVDWSAEALMHNTHNVVTDGIWRARAGSASVVLKVVSPGDDAAASEEWSPSEVPSHWNYWEREALAYESASRRSTRRPASPARASWPRTAVRTGT